MPHQTTIIALITTLTTGHILFLALYLWLRSAKNLPGRILSLLLFCYALRIIKSILLLTFPGLAFGNILIAIGVIGMSAIGPLLWMYIQSVTIENFRPAAKHLLHFLPALILLPTAFFLKPDLIFHVYQFSVYQIIAYLLYSIYFFKKAKLPINGKSNHKWITEFFVAASLLSIIFLLQLYTNDRTLYLVISIAAAIIFYVISLRAAFAKNAFYPQLQKKAKNPKTNLLPAIEEKLVRDHVYLDPQLTLSKLSDILQVPAYTLSNAINEEAGMGFNEYLNSFRIQEAALRLTSSRYQHLSIEGIAYDCGFNSLSAFYNAFKKIHGVTPAKFRQKSFPDSMNPEERIRKTEAL